MSDLQGSMHSVSQSTALTPAMAERFDHPYPEPLRMLSNEEQADFAGLSMIESVKFIPPTITQGDVVGVVMLRRNYHDGKFVGLVAEELPTFGLVVNVNGHVGYMAKGLRLLDKTGLEMFSRKCLELVRSVVVEGVHREPKQDGGAHG